MLTNLEKAIVIAWRTNCRQSIQSFSRKQRKAGSTVFEVWKSVEHTLKPRFTSILHPEALGYPLRAWFVITPKNARKVLDVLSTNQIVNTALHTNTGFIAEVFAKDMLQIAIFQAQLEPHADLQTMHVLEVIKKEMCSC
ncbi:MAG: Lrp/AsnC family transcriptional regulator [Candidatus Woesearchaeota archaeon]|nr:Lrp/AsnC family transcriptional regulator [Candidatus Woesearchaeota archaeon]